MSNIAPYVFRPNTLTDFEAPEKVENLMNDKYVPAFTTITNPLPYSLTGAPPSGIAQPIPVFQPQLPSSTISYLQQDQSPLNTQNSIDSFISSLEQGQNGTYSFPSPSSSSTSTTSSTTTTSNPSFDNLYQVFENPDMNALSLFGNTLSYAGGLYDSTIPGFNGVGDYIPNQTTNGGGFFYPVPTLQALYGNNYPQATASNGLGTI